MVALPQKYDVETLPDDEFTPIPEGEYQALITESEMKDTKAGTGQYLQLTMDITAGEHKGRKLIERLNLVNPNTTAVEIAYKQLKKLMLATGVTGDLADSNQLHNIPFTVVVGVEEGKDWTDAEGNVKEGRPQNTIKNYKGVTQNTPTQVKPAAYSGSAQKEESTADNSAAPWAK